MIARLIPEANKCIADLLDAVDSYIPEPERELDKPFLMAIEDVFSIAFHKDQ